MTYDCVLGRSGIHFEKHEGDGRTPAGTFALRRALYRPDRIARPATSLPAQTIQTTDGWCDDPADAAYNRLVMLPYPARTEALWREDHVYDVIVVLGHNDAPVIPGAGSAIFMHVARDDFAPTEGCVALTLSDLLAVLSDCTTESTIRIQSSD